jgi:hypothetical protein
MGWACAPGFYRFQTNFQGKNHKWGYISSLSKYRFGAGRVENWFVRNGLSNLKKFHEALLSKGVGNSEEQRNSCYRKGDRSTWS